MMEIEEVAEKLAEFEEEEHAGDSFRRRLGVMISVLAMVLAITAVGGNKTGKELVSSAIAASDTWAFFQAKSVRQTTYVLAADQLEATLALSDLSPEGRQSITEKIAHYRDTAKRYESESDGTGKKELSAKAQHFEHERELAEQREPYFSMAEALLQIAIVLASAAIATNTRLLVYFGGLLGIGGTLMAINAFFLLVELPI